MGEGRKNRTMASSTETLPNSTKTTARIGKPSRDFRFAARRVVDSVSHDFGVAGRREQVRGRPQPLAAATQPNPALGAGSQINPKGSGSESWKEGRNY